MQNRFVMRGVQPVGVQGTMMDITEHRSLEERFLQAQKMEAVGRLAGGVAHDFNNMLMVIQGFSDITAKSLATDDKRQMYVGEIRKAAECAATLTRQLLTFSRKQVSRSEVVNLATVVSDAEKMLKHLIGEDIQLVVSTDPLTPDVKADPGHLVQVLMNLAVNARDAMPDGGILTIKTSPVVVDGTTPALPDVEPGEYAAMTVSDSGTGMSAEVLAHLFEPFFTTKEKGKGTGLGLATVYGIVKQSGGHLWCLSRPGGGTTFSMYLPRTKETGTGPGTARPEPEQGRCGGTILLVEDDDSVRRMTRTVLEQNGYSVLECRNGTEALDVFEKDHEGVDLLITDMVLPGMSGVQIAEAIDRKKPGMGIIVMSGYGDRETGTLDGLSAPGLFIQKPIRPETLVRNVRLLLGRKSAA
jgi:nitrogen-specific signal transduction histidine kinase/CheY-like chemotaxis protein